MKKLILIALLMPSLVMADGYDDARLSAQQVLIALSQMSVSGRDAQTMVFAQTEVSRLAQSLGRLKDECEAKKIAPQPTPVPSKEEQ